MQLRKQFRDKMKVLVAKNKLTSLGFSRSDKPGLQELAKEVGGQTILIFSDMNPLTLNLLLEKNQINLPARAGDIATDEIIIPAGNTGIPAGPALSEFKEIGVQTRIDAGNIFVAKDTTVARAGDTISPKLAGMLSRLGIRPIRAGLGLVAAYHDGLIFKGGDISLDLGAFRYELQFSLHSALNLALNCSYPTVETIRLLLSKAKGHANSLSYQSGYLSEDTVGLVLKKGYSDAQALYMNATKKGYS